MGGNLKANGLLQDESYFFPLQIYSASMYLGRIQILIKGFRTLHKNRYDESSEIFSIFV